MRGAAMLGMETAFIGKIGSDELGEKLRAALKVQHVRPLLVMQEGMPTGIASAFITPDGQRTFADNLGASALLSPTDFQSDILNGYDTLFMEGYMVQNHDLITTVLSWAKERDMTTCIDLASYNVVSQEREFFHNLIERYIDIVFANEDESTALTGKNAENAAREMSQICQLAVVKMGSRGACAFVDGQLFTSPGVHVDNVIDTTGAGDSYCGAFVTALSEGKEIKEAMEFASKVSSIAVTRKGAIASLPLRSEIK
jgi:sugar/nucleoside kinase (ribokinase family)